MITLRCTQASCGRQNSKMVLRVTAPDVHMPTTALRWSCRCSHSGPKSVYLKTETLSALARPNHMSPLEDSFLQLVPEVRDTRSSWLGRKQASILWIAKAVYKARNCWHSLGAEKNLYLTAKRKRATQPYNHKEMNFANDQWASPVSFEEEQQT